MKFIIESYLALLVLVAGLVLFGVGCSKCFVSPQTVLKVIQK